MAPTTCCAFYDSLNKKKLDSEYNIYGAILIFDTIKQKRIKMTLSISARNTIVSRLKKTGESQIHSLKAQFPVVDLCSIGVIEDKFGIRVNLWEQLNTKTRSILVLESKANNDFDDPNLLTKHFLPDDPFK